MHQNSSMMKTTTTTTTTTKQEKSALSILVMYSMIWMGRISKFVSLQKKNSPEHCHQEAGINAKTQCMTNPSYELAGAFRSSEDRKAYMSIQQDPKEYLWTSSRNKFVGSQF